MLSIEKTLIENNRGQLFVQYTPVFEGHSNAEGKLRFASWQVEVGHPQSEHDAAKEKALANAEAVILRLAQ